MISKEQVKQQQEKGISLFKKKKYSEAIECFTKAISSCSYDTALYASTLYRRAIAYEEIGKLELALKDYSKALKIAPSHKQVQSKLDTYYIPEVQLNQYSHAEMLVASQQEINKLPNKTAITEIENRQHDKQRLLFIKACLDFLQALPFPVGNDNFPELSPKQHIFLDCYLTHQATEVYKAIVKAVEL